ncbi:uncharacterized protein LOC114796510 [Denticeps clupeoides]|uniref:uncharacterized protein LOC114796510 n=1 Tax=Denticeps clupeoides TaxID=299321 RepID=UPI0010A38B80|nr:uncharacterized protein LOC114796510 [Denticeps clupeoides]XP_028846547.1 uncharacterized protein LOC114796510 [Denticeps clupeoides]
MDVNVTVSSLMRGQLGSVVEKAVNIAVEMVLGEMVRVMVAKFDEIKKEMSAKEQENENIRQMLEISRSQMRAMRKYLNAVAAREDRQPLLGHPGSPLVASRLRDPTSTDIRLIGADGTTTVVTSIKEEKLESPALDTGHQETSVETEPAGATPQAPARAPGALCGTSVGVKEEMAIKEEPEEVETSPVVEGHSSVLDSVGPSADHNPVYYTPAASSAYPDAQTTLAGVVPRQERPLLRDLNLYEQYKHARAELRRRSQLRRRELEKDLPQALLADLVKERREKTRLRVARWRAKRKLQACLVSSQAAGQQRPGPQASAPPAKLQRGVGGWPQYSAGFPFPEAGPRDPAAHMAHRYGAAASYAHQRTLGTDLELSQ